MNKNKTVLITGGAKRIGAALVRALHAKGMNVFFQYHRSAEKADELIRLLNQKRPGSVAGISADLEQADTCQLLSDKAREHFGKLDVLINNAAGFFPTPLGQANQQDWDQLMNINAKAPFFLAQSCQQLLKHSRGSIINLTDIYADRPAYDYPIYCASKAALNILTLSLAQAFAPDVRVNAIAPGAILAPEHGGEHSVRDLVGNTPLRRLGGEDSIVETALFLINQASFITGQIIRVDGGRSAISG